MSLECHSCAQTLDRGERCLGPDIIATSSAKLPGRRPPAHWTGKGQLNEGDMFGE